jgi:Outer membrane protein beta-barrel domain
MNEQQPYEKHLAEKFQQLSQPDVEPNWQQMKLLLDKEMPRGGGFWRWITGIGILLLMLGGTWVFMSRKEPATAVNTIAHKSAGSTESATKPGSSTANTPEKDVRKSNETGLSLKEPSASSFGPQANDSIKAEDIEENLHNPGPVIVAGTNRPLQSNSTNTVGRNSNRSENETRRPITNKSSYNGPRRQTIDLPVIPGLAFSPGKGTRQNTPEGIMVKTSPVLFSTGNVLEDEDVDTDKLIDDSIGQKYSYAMFPENKQSAKLSRKSKAVKTAGLSTGAIKTLAFGFSLPMGFPLGDQKPGAYNINAKPNTVSDFIPVPHMQYHLNSKVYLQTELQVANPQFIQPVLMYQTKTDIPGTNSIQYNSVYARKLYYFNIPVGIHYAPFQHFYLGTGLQFSSFISGVALEEKTSTVVGSGTNTLISEKYTKFKDDSLSGKIDNSEFRLMLDANYYWKQFTVGLRYNQALTNYVSFRLDPASPIFADKNKSLQFYLRYNFWERPKKK